MTCPTKVVLSLQIGVSTAASGVHSGIFHKLKMGELAFTDPYVGSRRRPDGNPFSKGRGCVGLDRRLVCKELQKDFLRPPHRTIISSSRFGIGNFNQSFTASSSPQTWMGYPIDVEL